MTETLYGGLTEAEVKELSEIMLEKVSMFDEHGGQVTLDKVQQIVIDTLLTADGTVTMDRWRLGRQVEVGGATKAEDKGDPYTWESGT